MKINKNKIKIKRNSKSNKKYRNRALFSKTKKQRKIEKKSRKNQEKSSKMPFCKGITQGFYKKKTVIFLLFYAECQWENEKTWQKVSKMSKIIKKA